MTTEDHASYAPSSAHRWIACTASATAIAQLGEREESEAAAEGTAAHTELERVMGTQNGRMSDERYGYAPNEDHPAAYAVALTLDYIRRLPPGKLWVEQRVRLTDEIWGRCDIAHWHAESATLTVVDLKNGFVNVEAEDNEQLQIYAAASIYTHNLPAKWIRMVVVQPNSFMPVPRVKQWITTAEALYAFATRVAAIPSGPLEFRAGEHCKYCPIFGRCPASQDVLQHLAVALAKAPDDVPTQQVALMLAMKKPVEDWFKALEKAGTKKALAGAVPPGMKVVQTTKHLAWLDETRARQFVIDRFGVNALDPPSPAQVKELGATSAEVDAMAQRPEGGPALAFESDKRPTWAPKSVAKMFEGVTGQ